MGSTAANIFKFTLITLVILAFITGVVIIIIYFTTIDKVTDTINEAISKLPPTTTTENNYKVRAYHILNNKFHDYKFDTPEDRNEIIEYIKLSFRTIEGEYVPEKYMLRLSYLNKMDDFTSLSDYSIHKFAIYWEAISIIYYKRIFWDSPDFKTLNEEYKTFNKFSAVNREKVNELANKYLKEIGKEVKAENLSDSDIYNFMQPS